MLAVPNESSIYHTDKPEVDHEFGSVFNPGFYFADETQQLNGPFDTLEEAKRILKLYVESICG